MNTSWTTLYNTELGKEKAMHKGRTESTKKICLALQGGGAYGAYTWGILDKFLEDMRLEIDAISATSAGSVNAVALAYGMCKGGREGAREALYDFWHTLGVYWNSFSPTYQTPFEILLGIDITSQASFLIFDTLSRTISPYHLNPTNYNLLRELLIDKIDFEVLNNTTKIKLFLCATNVKTGKLKIFENHHISIDSVMASSCLPHLYQAVEIDNEFYWDGGFLGNPAIFPLIYNSKVDDIIIVNTNPVIRDTLPISSAEIASRTNEVSFNSSLMRELRAISFITKLLDDGWIKEEFRSKIDKKFIHIVRSDEILKHFNHAKKYNLHWDFLTHLRDLGRKSAEDWLEKNFHKIGKESTINYDDFF